jgi:hypothetical protein
MAAKIVPNNHSALSPSMAIEVGQQETVFSA